MSETREFMALLGGAAAAWPLGASAQRPNSRIAHIAYLGVSSPSALDPRNIEQFKQGLAENGLVEDRDVTVDYLWAEGSPERLRELAVQLAQRDLDVIVTAGPQPVRALLATQTKTPIVFAIHSDPVGDGIVESLARPGVNMTGLSMANSNLESKRLEALKDAFSALKRVMILYDPTMGVSGLIDAQSGARALAIELLIVEAGDPAQFDTVFARAADQGANGLAAMASPFLNFHRKQLIELAAQHRFPRSGRRPHCQRRRVSILRPELSDMYRHLFTLLRFYGAKPSDLPIEQPIKSEFAVNLKPPRHSARNSTVASPAPTR